MFDNEGPTPEEGPRYRLGISLINSLTKLDQCWLRGRLIICPSALRSDFFPQKNLYSIKISPREY
jgi:hypothetical protein